MDPHHAASRVHNSTCSSSPFCSHSKLLSFVEVLKYLQNLKLYNLMFFKTMLVHRNYRQRRFRSFVFLFEEAPQQQQTTTRRKKTKLWGEKLTSFVFWPRFSDLMPLNLPPRHCIQWQQCDDQSENRKYRWPATPKVQLVCANSCPNLSGSLEVKRLPKVTWNFSYFIFLLSWYH